MQQVYLNYSKLKVSNICLGGENFGEKLDEAGTFQVLDAFLEAGGNFVDTAKVYCSWVTGDNSSEQYIAKWLKSRNAYEKMIIASKGGCYDSSCDGPRVNQSMVEQDLDESLKTLGMDCIPLYYLHRDDPSKPVEEIIDFCEGFVKKGKIRYYGISNWDLSRADAAFEYTQKNHLQGFSGIENQYSLGFVKKENNMNQDKTLTLSDLNYLQWHRKSSMPLFPYTSTAAGFYDKLEKSGCQVENGKIVGKIEKLNLPEPMVKAYVNPCNLKRFEYMKTLKEKYGCSMVQLSLAYLTNQDFQMVPIVSVRNLEQLSEVTKAGDLKLTLEEVIKLESFEWNVNE
jgi:aryl-alcohol dehydrogenase-like predicted oxidoreductase